MSALPLFCMDTHAIYWRRTASPKLSAAAAQVFDDSVQGNATLIVHDIVVAELFYLLEKYGQVALHPPLLADFQSLPYYRLEPLALADLAALDSMSEIPEMHDRLSAGSQAAGSDHRDEGRGHARVAASEMFVVTAATRSSNRRRR